MFVLLISFYESLPIIIIYVACYKHKFALFTQIAFLSDEIFSYTEGRSIIVTLVFLKDSHDVFQCNTITITMVTKVSDATTRLNTNSVHS